MHQMVVTCFFDNYSLCDHVVESNMILLGSNHGLTVTYPNVIQTFFKSKTSTVEMLYENCEL